jgi:hypothetical protein
LLILSTWSNLELDLSLPAISPLATNQRTFHFLSDVSEAIPQNVHAMRPSVPKTAQDPFPRARPYGSARPAAANSMNSIVGQKSRSYACKSSHAAFSCSGRWTRSRVDAATRFPVSMQRVLRSSACVSAAALRPAPRGRFVWAWATWAWVAFGRFILHLVRARPAGRGQILIPLQSSNPKLFRPPNSRVE